MEQRTGGGGTVGKSNNGEFGSATRDLTNRAQEEFDHLRERMGDASERIAGFIRERPGTAVLIAVGAGFLIGRLLRS